MKFLHTLMGFIAAVTITGLAVLNPQISPLHFSPVHPPLKYPLYMIILGCILAGFLLGALSVWINSRAPLRDLRKTKKQQNKDIKRLERSLEDNAK